VSDALPRTLLFVTPSAYPLGGVAEWLDYLLPGLEERGWRCVRGLAVGHHHDAEAYLAKHPWHDEIRIFNPTGSLVGRINAVINAFDKVRPDVVVSINIAAVYEAIRRIRITRTSSPRVVMALHGLQADLLGDVASQSDVMDAVITVNRLAVALAGERGAEQRRVFYAPCGVPVVEQSTGDRQLGNGPLKLMYCGRIEESQKRVSDLVELAVRLTARNVAFKISIAGAGPDEPKLKEIIDVRGLRECFYFLGVLSPVELAVEYPQHDALLITSSWETGPIVAWEAMSHGLPVISSRYVGYGLEAALVHGQNSLLFPVVDMAAAADEVQGLQASGVRDRLVRGGLDLVRSRYSRPASVQLWDGALSSVLRLPAMPAPRAPLAFPTSGRFDQMLGARLGERLRRSFRKEHRHTEPGGEWPHTLSMPTESADFLAQVAVLDQCIGSDVVPART